MAGDSVEETLRARLCLNRCFLFSCFGVETHLFEPYLFASCFPNLPPVFVEFLYASLRRWAIDCSTEVRSARFIQHTCNESIWSGWF